MSKGMTAFDLTFTSGAYREASMRYEMYRRATWPERFRGSLLWAGLFNYGINLILMHLAKGGTLQFWFAMAWTVAIGVGAVGYRRWQARKVALALEMAVLND